MKNILKTDNYTFRFRDTNALDLLALGNQIDFSNFENAKNTYSTLLTFIEVQVKDSWIQAKQGEQYYPLELETNFVLLQDVCKFALDYVKEVFQSSIASKMKTE